MEDLQQNIDSIEEVVVDPLDELKAELAETKDQYLRARAETENVRKRGAEDAARARKFAIEGFAEHLVPVADSLYAALDHASDDVKKEFELVLNQLTSAFEKNKLVEIKPEIGDNFDPHKHQAISTVESEQDENTVVSVLQRGYLIADRVLRPAMVTVSKKADSNG
jgi:molecular chaperone GrpE